MAAGPPPSRESFNNGGPISIPSNVQLIYGSSDNENFPNSTPLNFSVNTNYASMSFQNTLQEIKANALQTNWRVSEFVLTENAKIDYKIMTIRCVIQARYTPPNNYVAMFFSQDDSFTRTIEDSYTFQIGTELNNHVTSWQTLSSAIRSSLLKYKNELFFRDPVEFVKSPTGEVLVRLPGYEQGLGGNLPENFTNHLDLKYCPLGSVCGTYTGDFGLVSSGFYFGQAFDELVQGEVVGDFETFSSNKTTLAGFLTFLFIDTLSATPFKLHVSSGTDVDIDVGDKIRIPTSREKVKLARLIGMPNDFLLDFQTFLFLLNTEEPGFFNPPEFKALTSTFKEHVEPHAFSFSIPNIPPTWTYYQSKQSDMSLTGASASLFVKFYTRSRLFELIPIPPDEFITSFELIHPLISMTQEPAQTAPYSGIKLPKYIISDRVYNIFPNTLFYDCKLGARFINDSIIVTSAADFTLDTDNIYLELVSDDVKQFSQINGQDSRTVAIIRTLISNVTGAIQQQPLQIPVINYILSLSATNFVMQYQAYQINNLVVNNFIPITWQASPNEIYLVTRTPSNQIDASMLSFRLVNKFGQSFNIQSTGRKKPLTEINCMITQYGTGILDNNSITRFAGRVSDIPTARVLMRQGRQRRRLR
jgi:hypothetical protein